eukprot:750049-Hanusia_phi.AAC.2
MSDVFFRTDLTLQLRAREMQLVQERQVKLLVGFLLVSVFLAIGSIVVITRTSYGSSLLELDGIPLDKNAMSQLNGDTERRPKSALSLIESHLSAKRINKLLEAHESGQIDGIPLDSHAMAKLDGGSSSRLAQASLQRPQTHRKVVSRAQNFLNQGKQDLDEGRWKSAIKDFSRAKDIWKSEGNDKYHWAQTLKSDVLRAHPRSSTGSKHASSSKSPAMNKAVRDISSGHAFRSLYGLMRERRALSKNTDAVSSALKAAARGVEQAKKGYSVSLATAKTQQLAQISKNSEDVRMKKLIQEAERRLAKKEKQIIREEFKKIYKQHYATGKSSNTIRLESPPTVLATNPYTDNEYAASGYASSGAQASMGSLVQQPQGASPYQPPAVQPSYPVQQLYGGSSEQVPGQEDIVEEEPAASYPQQQLAQGPFSPTSLAEQSSGNSPGEMCACSHDCRTDNLHSTSNQHQSSCWGESATRTVHDGWVNGPGCIGPLGFCWQFETGVSSTKRRLRLFFGRVSAVFEAPHQAAPTPVGVSAGDPAWHPATNTVLGSPGSDRPRPRSRPHPDSVQHASVVHSDGPTQ